MILCKHCQKEAEFSFGDDYLCRAHWDEAHQDLLRSRRGGSWLLVILLVGSAVGLWFLYSFLMSPDPNA